VRCKSCEIHIESLGQMYGLLSTVSLEPEPIRWMQSNLFGDRLLYYLLQEYDPDFSELFRWRRISKSASSATPTLICSTHA